VDPESDCPNAIFEDESSRLKSALKLCRNVVANYRAMLSEGSNDNTFEEAEPTQSDKIA
jgi:hypothetical protein